MYTSRDVPACMRGMFNLCLASVDSITLSIAEDILEARKSGNPEAFIPPGHHLLVLDTVFAYQLIRERFELVGEERMANINKALSVLAAVRWQDDLLSRLSDQLYELIADCPRIVLKRTDRLERIREFLTLVAESVLSYLIDNSDNPLCPVCDRTVCDDPQDASPSNVIPFDFSKRMH